MKAHHKDKSHIVAYCLDQMRQSELKAERDSIELIRKLQSLKKHKLREFEENPDENNDMAIEEEEGKLLDEVEKLEDELMQIEMLLQDALQAATSTFKDKVQVINQEMKKKTIEFIKFVAEEAENFHTMLRLHALEEQTKFETRISENEAALEEIENELDKDVYEFQLVYFSDKDALIGLLDTSKETMESKIQEKEQVINKAILTLQDQTETKLQKGQHSRNRSIVKEIIATCENFRNEIKEDFSAMKEQSEAG